MIISSVQNTKIKETAWLKERRARKETGLTLVDGAREVLHALQAGVAFREVFVCPEYLQRRRNKDLLKDLSRKRIPVHDVTPHVYEKISFGDRKDGVVAVCQPVPANFSGLKTDGEALFVVAENVEKPGNLGAILRTCDAAGVDALLVGDAKADIFNPNVIRSSIGAVFHVPAIPSDNAHILEFLRGRRVRVIAAVTQASREYTTVDLTGPLAVVVGSEEQGLSSFWTDHADEQVKIPMAGVTDSLNVSVSAAILLYETLRQRSRGKGGR